MKLPHETGSCVQEIEYKCRYAAADKHGYRPKDPKKERE